MRHPGPRRHLAIHLDALLEPSPIRLARRRTGITQLAGLRVFEVGRLKQLDQPQLPVQFRGDDFVDRLAGSERIRSQIRRASGADQAIDNSHGAGEIAVVHLGDALGHFLVTPDTQDQDMDELLMDRTELTAEQIIERGWVHEYLHLQAPAALRMRIVADSGTVFEIRSQINTPSAPADA